MPTKILPLVLLAALAACSGRVQPAVVQRNGQVVPRDSDRVIADSSAAARSERPAPAESAPALRGAALADQLLLEGDELAAAGQFPEALDRYDRADVVRPNHAATMLRIATALDKQLRPVEAVLQYRRFVHQLELERIRAQGEAAANIAAAITRAQERIVVLERRR